MKLEFPEINKLTAIQQAIFTYIISRSLYGINHNEGESISINIEPQYLENVGNKKKVLTSLVDNTVFRNR